MRRKRSGETRRGNRKRDAKLMKAAKIEFGLAESRAQMHQLIEAMFDQQQIAPRRKRHPRRIQRA